CRGYCVERAAAVKSRVAAPRRAPESFTSRAQATRAAPDARRGGGDPSAELMGGPRPMHWTHRAPTPKVRSRRHSSGPADAAPWEKEAHMTTTTSLSAREAALQASRDRVLDATRDRETLLSQATGVRMIAAWALVAAPRDP